MPRARSAELPNMPKPDGVGTAAQRLRTAIEKLDACKDEKDEAVENLMKSLVDAKRRDISIDGYKFEMRHEGPKDTIKIVKPK